MDGPKLDDDIGIAGEVTGYLITNMDEIKKDLSAEKFEKYIGKISDEADNFNYIREIEGNYYRLDADRDSDSTYITTRLVPVCDEGNKYVLNAVSYYLTEYGQQTLTADDEKLILEKPFEYLNKFYNEGKYEKRVDEFTVIKENGDWKIDKFVMPY